MRMTMHYKSAQFSKQHALQCILGIDISTLRKLTLYVRKLRAWKHTASSSRLRVRPLFSEWPYKRFIDNEEDWFTPITTYVAESMPERVTRTLTRAGVYVYKGEIGVRLFNLYAYIMSCYALYICTRVS